jgi:hypothetical protein
VKKKENKKNFEPEKNSEYIKHEYWNNRFKEEDEYEWLVSYKNIKS